MSLNAKYRGRKPKKYFESKYRYGTREDNENFKRSINENISTTELEETFLAYWEHATQVLGDYHYDSRTQIPHRHEESKAYTEDQKSFDLNAWWHSIKFKNDIQMQFEQNDIDWIQALEVKNISTSHNLENVDKYLRDSIDMNALTQSMHIQKMIFNKNLKKAIDDIPDKLLCWTCIMLPYWVNTPHNLPKETTGKELITHLLCRYKVADCLIYNLLHTNEFNFRNFITFFILGQGGSIYNLGAKFELAFPKGYLHYLNEVPEKTSIPDVFMYTYVRSLGGTDLDFNKLKTNPFYQYTPNLYWPFCKFKEETIEWVIAHSEKLTDNDYQNILEWATHIYTGRYSQYTQEEIVKLKFWSGRSLANVIQRSKDYKQSLRESLSNINWTSKQWDWEHINNKGERFVIKELLSSYEMYMEGKKMKHCVSLYWKKCKRGTSAIFSLTNENKKCLTIEVDPKSKCIIQARGKQNRSATKKEWELLNLWLREVVINRE